MGSRCGWGLLVWWRSWGVRIRAAVAGAGLVVAARPNAAPFTSGRVRRLQQGHALRVVFLLCQSEGCSFRVVLEVQPGPGLDEEVRALVVALVCGRMKGRHSFLLVGSGGQAG